jgi:ADP-heptose:LPS heptosyltransferase
VPFRPLADPAVRTVAVVRLRVGLGDLLCTVPALRALRAARPDLHVTLVTWAEVAPVVERMSAYVDRLLAFPGYPGIPERTPDAGGWQPFLREAGPFDLALQAYGDNPAANEVCARLDATAVGGFWPTAAASEPPRGHLRYPHEIHEIDRHLRLMAHLGLSVGDEPAVRALEFGVRPEDEAEDADLRTRHGLAAGSYVVVHPGATSPSRRWPAERFAAVADDIAARGLRVVVTGVTAEREVTADVVRRARSRPLDLTGVTSLGGLALLLRSAAVVVANDTGTAHLAAAVRTPSVTVYLSGDPALVVPRWPAPRGPRARGLQPVPAPQLSHRLPLPRRLSVQAVLAHVDALLRRSGSRRSA